MATPAAPPVFTSAAASRLPEDRLSAHEQQVFQYSSGLNNELQSLHLRMRNACLARWLNRPQLLLPKDVFVSEFIKGQPAMTVAESTETPAGQESSGTSFSSSLAAAVWSYLHRYRYINYGILQTPPPQQHTLPPPPASAPSNPTRRPSIVVLGAGIAGIAAARELHTLYSSSCIAPSHLHLYPSIIILEAKQRLGGRILSYPLHTKRTTTGTKYLKAKAASGTATATTSKLTGPRIDLGAQVVLGLENGNP